MSENKRNLTEKEEYYKLITDEKSNHIETNANGAGSQCVRRKNIGSLSFRERYLSLRQMGTLRVPVFLFAHQPTSSVNQYAIPPSGKVFPPFEKEEKSFFLWRKIIFST